MNKDKEELKKKSINLSNDKVDLIIIIKTIWNKRRFVVKITALFVIVGLLIAVTSKNEYKSSTLFTSTKESKTGGNLSNLASLAGINIGSSSSSNQISSTLYPKVVYSTPFLMELMEVKISFTEVEEKITYKDYYLNIYKPSLLELIKKYTIGLPGTIISSFSTEKNVLKKNSTNELLIISSNELKLLYSLKNSISININQNESFVDISVSMPDPIAAAELTKKTQELLQEYIIKFKIQKSKEELIFIEKQYKNKEIEFKKRQRVLAEFKDSNQSLNSARANSLLSKLQSEHDLVYAVFKELSKQLENQKLNVKKNTPVFIVLEPAIVPNNKSNQRKSLTVLIWGFLGVLLSALFVFCKTYIEKIKTNFETND